ncbi:helix-turn-helix transcriptional regulator [Achromobacter seleniivolatilans]|uniref:Helix-turn-helix transcriptional regulator n=1 Tax=Achromobacter seleniivolatilans TaxID=3047478 RepID=A0ABY9LVF4_9BURK|nr:helix-turn-helix transcriptional regulator [Achromobacter sp. R39]WMD18771.1 helix-turn-helix transcriptional regulator [Achromobacter sp. R39]
MQAPRPDLEAVLSALTPRERQIVGYVAAGRPNKVIAIDLGISLRTAEAHRARIFVKLDVRNAMQLACRLCAHGRSGASPILGALEAPVEADLMAPDQATAELPRADPTEVDLTRADLAGSDLTMAGLIAAERPAIIFAVVNAAPFRVLHCPQPEYGPEPSGAGKPDHDT